MLSDVSNKNSEIETLMIKNYIYDGNDVNATLLKGECFDCGTKQGYLKLNHKDSVK